MNCNVINFVGRHIFPVFFSSEIYVLFSAIIEVSLSSYISSILKFLVDQYL